MRLLMRLLDRLEETIIATLMAVATTIVFVAVVYRYGLTTAPNDLANWGKAHNIDWLFRGGRAVYFFFAAVSMTWVQELTVYLFVWMAKFGAAYGVRTGIHVGVDVALNRLPRASRNRVILFGLLCGATFTLTVGSLGARFVWHMAQHPDQVAASMQWLPVWIPYLAVPLGSYLMCFRFLQVAWTFSRTGALPHHDHGHVEGIGDETPLVPGATGVNAAPGGTL